MIDPHAFDVLTFDCYGTLIDWERGLLTALAPILDAHGVSRTSEETLERFGALEAEIEAGPYVRYREVLRRVLSAIGAHWGFSPSEEQIEVFAASVADWPAFPDVPGALRALGSRYALGVVSNVDDDLFAASVRRLAARIDWVVTAEQVGAYKPSPRNFQRAIERSGAPATRILHVAQSKYHDIGPAKALGLATVWVDRRRGRQGAGATPASQAAPDAEVRDLDELVRRLGLP